MAEPQQMFGGVERATVVIDRDRMGGDVAHPFHLHDMRAGGESQLHVALVGDGGEENRLDAALQERLDSRPLQGGIALGVVEEDGAAILRRRLFAPEGHPGEEGIGRDGIENVPDLGRALLAQALRHRVDLIATLGQRGVDRFPRGAGDIAVVVQHARHRAHRDTGALGDIFQGRRSQRLDA